MAEKAILFDPTKCMACRACQVACKGWNELPGEETTNRGTYENPPDLSAETWIKIRFKEISHNGTLRWLFTRQSCMHCTTAVCVMVCPTFARNPDDLGYVDIDQERCIGCNRCVEYCPFGIPRLGGHDVTGRVVVEIATPRSVTYNCSFCKDRVAEGLTPACVKTCPTGALQFGERDDLVEQGRARVNSLKATYPQAYLYGENELGGLHVMYILTEEISVYDLPETPQVATYPDFPMDEMPAWYTQAIAEGELPAFPISPLEPGAPAPGPPGPGMEWSEALGWSWLGLGVVGAGAALSVVISRRMRQQKEKQKGEES